MLTDEQFRIAVAIPLAVTAIGFLRTNYAGTDAAFLGLGDGQLLEAIDRYMPVRRMQPKTQALLLEEVRWLLMRVTPDETG